MLMEIDLGKVRHDLRTPINAIIGYGEMVAEDSEQDGLESFHQIVCTIVDEGRGLLKLINRLLATPIAPQTVGEFNATTAHSELAPAAASLRDQCQRLRATMEQCDSAAQFEPDVLQIANATDRFLQLLDDYLAPTG